MSDARDECREAGVTHTADTPHAAIRNPQSVLALWAGMIKLHHSVFALPFALIAVFLAGRERSSGYPGAWQLVFVVACMVAARSAAMTFNRIADARIDARNPRTAGRPLPAGTISLRQAIAFFVVCCVIFVGGCSAFLWLEANVWPIVLALPVLVYLCLYSYTKRFTRWSHFVLGSAIALSPPAAWLAIHPASIGWPALVLLGVVTCWIGGFDIIYACQDMEFDRREGLHSLPARLGIARALWIARGAHAITVVLLASLVPLAGMGWLYAAGVAAVALLLLIENLLVHPNDLSKVNLAFFTINGVVSLLLAACAIGDIVLHHAKA
jgi:4-hydroxybenzoate polyprenyltransferase